MHSVMGTRRSSLELMLEKIQQKAEEKTEDIPPALPVRPVSKARRPSGKRARPIKLNESGLSNGNAKKEVITTIREAKQQCGCGDNGGCLISKVMSSILIIFKVTSYSLFIILL